MSSTHSGRRTVTDVAGRWWRQADQFDWLSGYLHARGLAKPTRRLMAVVSGALIFMALGVLGTLDTAPVLTLTVSTAAAVAGIGYASLWLRRWPTKRQSLAMGVVGSALIVVGSVMQTDPVIALMGCTGLVVTGGYLAFFHDTRAVLFNLAMATAAAGFCAWRVLVAHDSTIAAVAGFWLIVELNLVVPLAIQTVVRTMGADVVRSDHDALTGLLNRRAFYERATVLLTSPSADLQLLVVMIDLDRFKHLNDTYGHLAGDEALAAVGWALRQASPSSAIIGRAGGEEFLVIATLPAAEADLLPATLCAAIAALPHPVTASVGAAITQWSSVPDAGAAIESLIATADAAMYQAKRDGGNKALVQRAASRFRT
ncbi:sensor domain-containing diguanylate cyclase [Mycolicibacterium iranicum]|uniref:Diguanylate cyclase n=1 Tax=Mycolicibacterium iranicum TaxID=912594 RepID=A0A1X1WN80_MYCIR|nr:GGDEF domain-containing protein [Mycolicibacterium iranicum]MCZ0728656.1 GGDEF domain-containing protein [Mycolicibacterium iranicum]ORV87993.1 diguanylate cyclase [Mycolicibacterium iranicum]